jgi:hypothetical protein
MRSLGLGALVLIGAVLVGDALPASAQSRSVGQVIDDTAITAEVKAKLVADTLSNLTKINVSTRNGVVTLTGEVVASEIRARAVRIASLVKGVQSVVDNIQVAGGPAPPVAATSEGSPAVDVTGVVSQVDPATGTIILKDGRVLRMTSETMVWQPTTIQSLQPGTPVLLRGAAPLGVQSAPAAPVGAQPPVPASEWRMGTVQSADRASSRLVLTDGTVVRLGPGVNVLRGAERLTVEQVVPGSEIVFRPTAPRPAGPAEGSASPGTSSVYDAAEVNVVWMPAGSMR